MTIMVVNKQLSSGADLNLTLTNFAGSGLAQTWQLTATNSIKRLADLALSAKTLTTTVAPQSITLFVLPATVAAPPPPVLKAGSLVGTNTFDLWVNGQAGQSYVLQSTTNFINWSPIQTNTLTSNSWHVLVPVSKNQPIFYRAR